ncbi:MAG: heavy metal translocating P-type ATPase [Atopobiaceae bacterium]
MRQKIEALLDAGGTRKDVTLLVISAVALVASIAGAGAVLPFDPAWVAIVLCGVPIVVRAAIAVVCDHDIKADMLVSIALVASVCIGEYFAAGEVALIMQLGGLLEEITTQRARSGIQRLVELTPRVARVVGADGNETEVPAAQVQLGQLVRVLPGEAIPVDGEVVNGSTSVDEAVMTGEPMPQDKQPGDTVTSGTTNQFGAIDVRATRVGEDGSIQRMVRLVQSADAGKAKVVRMADRWATWVVVGALSAAVLAYAFTGEILRSVTVLVVFCPCSLVLATPTAIMAAIGNATRHGFLVKEGDALERLAQVRKLAFDKTGTLTRGKPGVTRLCALSGAGFRDAELAALVASAELRSEHPLGRAVVDHVRASGADVSQPDEFRMVPGQGVDAVVGGRRVCVGNATMMSRLGVSADAQQDFGSADLLRQGCTVSYVAVDGRVAGLVALFDDPRPESAGLVWSLESQEVGSVLLTGDCRAAAQAVAHSLGMGECVADCRPEDKMAYVARAEQGGERLAMVGDGVNDAPALKRAFVGIAMGGVGSDIAMDAADIVITRDNVAELPHLVALSHRTMKTIRANLTFSMTLNFVAVVLAILAVLDPVTGALVHNCGSVFVIVCSGLLLNWEGDRRRAD